MPISAPDINSVPGARKWFKEQVARSKGGIVTEVVTLTPALARILLENNEGNRAIRPAKLSQYVSDIQNDRWQLNGEPIIIADNGLLNNGQHRSTAVIEAQKPIQTVMLFGVAPETRKTVDNGANRTAGDHLSIEGFAYGISLSSITRYVLAYERGNKERMLETNRVTPSEIIDRASQDEALQTAAAFPYKSLHRAKRFAPPSVMGFCHYVLSKKDPEQAEEYLSQVIHGTGLEFESPAYKVREKLIETNSKLREHKIEIILKGWNAFRKGNTMRRIIVNNQFPEIV